MSTGQTCAAPSSDASRPRPSGCPSCRSCSTSPTAVVLVEHRECFVLVAARHEVFVVRVPLGNRLPRMRDDEHFFEVRPLAKLLEQRQEHVVDDHEAVARVRRDERDVVRVQSQVQRVEHTARTRHREVRLQMLRVVPHEGRDAIALLHPRPSQRRRELARALVELTVRRAVKALVRPARDHLDVGELNAGALEHARESQREIHHRTAHRHTSIRSR